MFDAPYQKVESETISSRVGDQFMLEKERVNRQGLFYTKARHCSYIL